MNKLLAKSLFGFLIFALASSSLSAQSVVGSWRRTAIITTYENGKSVDEMALLTKEMPCIADIVYVFEANGNLTMRVPKGCPIPAVLSTWKLNGTTLITSMKGFSTTDQVSVSSGTMSTTHVYGPQDKYAPKGAKSLKVVYQKL